MSKELLNSLIEQNSDESQKIKKIYEKIKRVYEKGIIYQFGFVDQYELTLIETIANKFKIKIITAEETIACTRKYVTVSNNQNMEQKKYPMIIRANYSQKFNKLDHPQIKGALYNNLMIEDIGDIYVSSENVVEFYVNSAIIDDIHAITHIDKVPVKFSEIEKLTIEPKALFKRKIIVKSLRLDNVLKGIVGKPRGKIQTKIGQREIKINAMVVSKYTKEIKSGDIVEIYRYGKIVIERIEKLKHSYLIEYASTK